MPGRPNMDLYEAGRPQPKDVDVIPGDSATIVLPPGPPGGGKGSRMWVTSGPGHKEVMEARVRSEGWLGPKFQESYLTDLQLKDIQEGVRQFKAGEITEKELKEGIERINKTFSAVRKANKAALFEDAARSVMKGKIPEELKGAEGLPPESRTQWIKDQLQKRWEQENIRHRQSDQMLRNNPGLFQGLKEDIG